MKKGLLGAPRPFGLTPLKNVNNKSREEVRQEVISELPIEDIDEQIRDFVIWINVEGYNHIKTIYSCAGHKVLDWDTPANISPEIGVKGLDVCVDKLEKIVSEMGVTYYPIEDSIFIEPCVADAKKVLLQIADRLYKHGYIAEHPTEKPMGLVDVVEDIEDLPEKLTAPTDEEQKQINKIVHQGREEIERVFVKFFNRYRFCKND